MGRKLKKWLVLTAMIIGICATGTMTAFANTSGTIQQSGGAVEADGESTTSKQEEKNVTKSGNKSTAVPETDVESSGQEATGRVVGETPADSSNTPFSVSGNGEILDDKKEDGTKQFVTIQTKNGNTFFLVIDRSSGTDNVYLLSMVDEDDLAAFLDETGDGTSQGTIPQLVLPEKDSDAGQVEQEKTKETADAKETEETKEAKETVNPKQKDDGRNTGTMLAVVLLIAVLIGGIYYLKVVRPRKEQGESESEDLEMYGDGEPDSEEQADEDD